MDLQQYDRMKSALAEVLRAAAMRPLPQRDREMVRDLFARLAEDRFNLVVVGRFSRGKTSLMNAMLRTDRLPTGIVPVTSVITAVTYGTEEKVVLFYQHTSLFFEIPISQLAEHITERGNPGNGRRIHTAEVQLPAELLRRGFHFIDTPGLGSSIVENTRTTEAFLPQADAFILVTSFDSPLTEEEVRILQTVHASGRRAFVVVNKQDSVSAEQRQEVLSHLATQLPAILGDTPAPVFPLSAAQALDARLHGKVPLLTESGVPAFEAALLDFLVNEKRHTFLLNMSARIGAVIGDQLGAREDRARLAALRSAIEAAQSTTVAHDALAPDATLSPTLPACEVCAAIAEALFDYLAALQYQLSGDQRVQSALAARHGLCGPHTWQFEAVAAPKEICTGFAGVVEAQAAMLRATAQRDLPGPLAREQVEAALPTAQSCAACTAGHAAERRAIAAAADRLARDPATALPALSAICLPHLRLLIGALHESRLARRVLERQADLLDRIAEDMRHFALKRDGSQRHLLTKEEVAAGERALRVLVGNPRAHMGPAAPRAAPRVAAPPARAPGP
ncbi:MAG: dynamin family protein [Alphaproteobacteria bacterium]|nr:dynamin family protein [Alphaproteobacteria bacterium]